MSITINGSGTISGVSATGLTTAQTVTQSAIGANVVGTGPAFSAYASASQTVTLATVTKVAIDTENFDTNSNFDTTLYRFTPTVAGYYQVNGSLKGSAATTFTSIIAYIYKNGAEISRAQITSTLTAGGSTSISVNNIVYMNGTTDYLELYGFVNGTGTASFPFATAASTSQFSASLVRTA